MTFLNEDFGKELQRMSELAGIPKNLINENVNFDYNIYKTIPTNEIEKSLITIVKSNPEEIEGINKLLQKDGILWNRLINQDDIIKYFNIISNNIIFGTEGVTTARNLLNNKNILAEFESKGISAKTIQLLKRYFVANEQLDILKEQDDLFGDIGDIFNQQNNALQGKPSTANKLDKDLKAAMVLNNVSEFEAVALELYTKYNPKTAGAKPEDMGGTAGTIFGKKSVEKFPKASRELNRMKNIGQATKGNNFPVSFGENPESKNKGSFLSDKQSLAKWQPLHKDESIISYEKNVDKFGHETFTLSDKGKQQLEYLQRMYSERPLTPNGDPNIDIESVLLDNDFIYKNVVITNSEKIIRDFFNKAVVPIIASSLKRTTAAPKDSQFERFVRVGVDHALDQTKKGKYNSDKFSNYGAWFMQVVKNKVIDQLKSQTTFKLDTANVYDMLSNMPGPLNIDSQLNPDEATGNYDSVSQSRNTFTKDGLEKNYFTYTYNKPENALADLEAKAIKTDNGFKKSPLRAAYLRDPGAFYKSYMEHMPAELSQATVEPAYFEKYQDVPAKVVLKVAKNEIDNILTQIAKEIVVSTAKVGEMVKLSGRENANYPTLTKGKPYEVIEKGEDPIVGGGKPKKYYYVTDDKGEKIKVSARALTPIESVEGKIVSKARENELAVIELLRLLLQYGRMKAVYTKTVYLPKAEGGWATKNVGEAVAKDRTGKIILPYASPREGSRFRDLDNAPIEYVWSSEKYSDDVNEKLIDDLSNVAKAKNLILPSQYFNYDNEPRYKIKGSSPDIKKKTIEFVNGVRNALRRFFGFSTLENPIIKQNRDVLKRLLDNLSKSQEAISKNIAENEIRAMIKELISEKIKSTEELEEISDNAQDWISKKIAYLISKEGLSQKQAAGKAYGMARKKGYKIPEK